MMKFVRMIALGEFQSGAKKDEPVVREMMG
jgi:hypothetical protein